MPKKKIEPTISSEASKVSDGAGQIATGAGEIAGGAAKMIGGVKNSLKGVDDFFANGNSQYIGPAATKAIVAGKKLLNKVTDHLFTRSESAPELEDVTVEVEDDEPTGG